VHGQVWKTKGIQRPTLNIQRSTAQCSMFNTQGCHPEQDPFIQTTPRLSHCVIHKTRAGGRRSPTRYFVIPSGGMEKKTSLS